LLGLSRYGRNANIDVLLLPSRLALKEHGHEHDHEEHQHDRAYQASPGTFPQLQLFVGNLRLGHGGQYVKKLVAIPCTQGCGYGVKGSEHHNFIIRPRALPRSLQGIGNIGAARHRCRDAGRA